MLRGKVREMLTALSVYRKLSVDKRQPTYDTVLSAPDSGAAVVEFKSLMCVNVEQVGR